MKIIKQEKANYCKNCNSFVKEDSFTHLWNCNCIYDIDVFDLNCDYPCSWARVIVDYYEDEKGNLKNLITEVI
ncbi:MAG: hypothetical protein ACTSXD_02060 [Candidatus Heimdallarchaeaceae archaeon]